MTPLMEFTNNIYKCLDDEYGNRIMCYPFMSNDEKSSYIEGIIDKRAFQIHFYEKSVKIRFDICLGGIDLLKELYNYLLTYLEPYDIRNKVFDWYHNNGQINILLNKDLINKRGKTYLKK